MRRLTNVLILYILLVLSLTGYGQSADTLNQKRLVAYAVGTGVVYTGTMVYLGNQWYSEFEKQPFHFFDDSKEWKQVDKAGHMYGAYQLQNISYHALRHTGLNAEKSLLWSGVTSFLFISSIELFDGYSAEYGASVSDVVANASGIGLFTFQQLLWKENRIHLKFSFQQTDYPPLRPSLLGEGWHEEVVKDYNGQSYWLSFDIHSLTNKKFPKWLNVAVGYGAQDMIFANDEANREAGYSPYRQWYIGPDIDLTHFKSKSKAVNTILFALNMIRIPAPALEYNKHGWSWHWLK
jgi:hypothetical protein